MHVCVWVCVLVCVGASDPSALIEHLCVVSDFAHAAVKLPLSAYLNIHVCEGA